MAFSLKRFSKPPVKVESEAEGEAPKLGKRKPFKATSGTKFVLFHYGDEGAILIYNQGKTVQSRQFGPDASQQGLNELSQSLAKDPRAPMMIVIDTMDQSYVQQTLPPVSSLSVNKLIKHRLARDFGANDIKGAILLGREKTGRKTGIFSWCRWRKARSSWSGSISSARCPTRSRAFISFRSKPKD